MTEFAAVFSAGLASAGSPCLLPLYPGFLAYLAASGDVRPRRLGGALLGLLVLAGVLTTMVALGTAFVALTLPVGRVATGFRPVVDGVLVLLGLLLLVGRNPFQRVGSVGVAVRGGPFARAYLYGLVLGPLALPCAGPFFAPPSSPWRRTSAISPSAWRPSSSSGSASPSRSWPSRS